MSIIHNTILGHRNSVKTDQWNPVFHIFADLVNIVVVRQSSDCLVPISLFSHTVLISSNKIKLYVTGDLIFLQSSNLIIQNVSDIRVRLH